MASNPYKKPEMLSIFVPAEMAESVAGFGDTDLRREYFFALESADIDNSDTLRWLAAIIDGILTDNPEEPPTFDSN